ncbi:hypothetical protein VNO80_19312 [Phaseolus coccineus]|uniref:Uncharacterized protein n=1 Tax=Phaseolus coccineus TaxID=3886 RepID=A0AAN9MJA3_PHACN
MPTLETAQPEVGSSGWKSTARRVVSGAPPATLENSEDQVPPMPDRTHHCIRIGFESWAEGPSTEPVGYRWTARAASVVRVDRHVLVRGRIGNGPFGASSPDVE